jgi:DnaJ family protein C protein 2
MVEMRQLSDAPAGFKPLQKTYSLTQCRREFAGRAVFEKYEKEEVAEVAVENKQVDASPSQEEKFSFDPDYVKRKKNHKEDSCADRRIHQALESKLDLYKALHVPQKSSVEEIKKAFRQASLIFHPDKRNQKPGNPVIGMDGDAWVDPSTLNDEEYKQAFLDASVAHEILTSESLRKQYDSTLPFDEFLPAKEEVARKAKTPEFYQWAQQYFDKESYFANVLPAPKFGDANTPIEELQVFYKYWLNFDSWRDFSSAGEYKLEEAEDSTDRAWMQKENWKVVSALVNANAKRLARFVIACEDRDPRMVAYRNAQYEAQKAAKPKKLSKAEVRALREAQEKAAREAAMALM